MKKTMTFRFWTWMAIVLVVAVGMVSCALEPRTDSLSFVLKLPRDTLSGGLRYLLYDADKYTFNAYAPNHINEYNPIDAAHYPNDNPHIIQGTTLEYSEQLGGYPVIIEGIVPSRRLRIALHAYPSTSTYYYSYWDGYNTIIDYNSLAGDVAKLASSAPFNVEAGQITTVVTAPWQTIYY
jgi:hypothetical protein